MIVSDSNPCALSLALFALIFPFLGAGGFGRVKRGRCLVVFHGRQRVLSRWDLNLSVPTFTDHTIPGFLMVE